MLIFGGMTARNLYVNKTKLLMFDHCEFYDEKYDLESE